jgi:hypothetical protein
VWNIMETSRVRLGIQGLHPTTEMVAVLVRL